MMPPLTKAVIYKLKAGQPAGKGKTPNVKIDGDPIPVQFNPTSLRIQRQNNVDAGGTTTLTQHRQNPSQRPATLTLDLEFDTAEGDDNGQPLDVRVRTGQIRQFVEPDPAKPADPPPRVLFLWGTLNFAGIVTQLTEDLDYFGSDGMALRAKVSVTITEQNLAFEAMKQGSGARDAAGSTPPGGAPAGTGPGSGGTSNPVLAALAQAGESIQQLLTRLDQDPAAWRSAMNGLTSPLSLPAGTQVQLAAAASAAAGIGVSAGVAAGASAANPAGAAAAFSAGADVDVVAAANASSSAASFAGLPAPVAAGFALAAGGGVEASYNAVVSTQVNAAVGSARASFAVPDASATPAGVTALVDARAVGFGRGIPLSRRADSNTVTGSSAGGQLVIGARAQGAEVSRPASPLTPPWQSPAATPR